LTGASAVRVLVTRPAHDAPAWVVLLNSYGVEAQALPLIDIADAPDAAALVAARERLPDYGALMFVSANAATRFWASHPALTPEAVTQVVGAKRAWVTGPGTADALRRVGWPAAQIDTPGPQSPQFDSEALWAVVQAQARSPLRVLIVRGSDVQGRMAGRDWLAKQLAEASVQVDTVVAYARQRPLLDAAQHALAAQAATDGTVWLFSSAEAIANLCSLLPGQSWAAARAVTTHPRIAQAARRAGFGAVRESRPGAADLVTSIESFA
jgi:uroporphyrinogen-III synthase